MRCRFTLHVLGAILAFLSCGIAASDSGANTVRVHVIVQTENLEPLSDVLVAIAVENRRLRDAKTDEAGKAILELDVAPGTSEVEVQHGFARPSSFTSTQEQLEISQQQERLTAKFHLARTHRIALQPGQKDYQVTITAWPAIEVRAAIVDVQGQFRNGKIFGPAHSFFGSTENGRIKPLRGIRKGAPVLLVATSTISSPATVLKPIVLDANQTSENLDLGSIVVPAISTGVPINVAIEGDKQLRQSGEFAYWPGLTFVARDGSVIAAFQAKGGMVSPTSEGQLPLETSGGQPSLPAGEYFVVPGWFLYSDDQSWLLSMVLKGVDLSGSKIPRITVRDGAANEFTINVMEAHEAIRAVVSRQANATQPAAASTIPK